jgi:hypothetical protein
MVAPWLTERQRRSLIMLQLLVDVVVCVDAVEDGRSPVPVVCATGSRSSTASLPGDDAAGDRGSIVVALEESDRGHVALAFAMDQASALGLDVVAATVLPFDGAELSRARGAAQAQTDIYRARYPHVSLTHQFVFGAAVEELGGAVGGANMLVVGVGSESRATEFDVPTGLATLRDARRSDAAGQMRHQTGHADCPHPLSVK